MSSEWQRIQLADAPLTILDGDRGTNYPSQDEFTPSGHCLFLNTGNVTTEGFNFSNCAFITAEKDAALRKGKLVCNDVVLTTRGTVGNVGYFHEGVRFTHVRINSGMVILRSDQFKLSSYFLYLFVRSTLFKEQVKLLQSGSAQPQLPIRDMKRIEIPLPPIDDQAAICDILGTLDDRITLLRETNATLEAIAQAQFKSWFVDFDPVRAKMEGRLPVGMDEAMAALFPDSFEESELGLVPRGWSYVSLKEVVSIYDSKRVPLSGQEREKRQGLYPYYGAAALMDFVDDYLFDGIYLLTGEDGSVANASGFSIMQYVWGKFWVNNHAHILQGKAGLATEHVMLALQGINITPYITGAVQAKLSQTNMWRINILKPSLQLSEYFGSILEPLFVRFRHNAEQAKTLSTLRDTLLPRLISGQLRLPQAGSATREALA